MCSKASRARGCVGSAHSRCECLHRRRSTPKPRCPRRCEDLQHSEIAGYSQPCPEREQALRGDVPAMTTTWRRARRGTATANRSPRSAVVTDLRAKTGLVLDDGATRRRGQARKLEREDGLGIAHRRDQPIETLQVSGRGTASTGRQSPSGGRRNEAAKAGRVKPEGAEAQEGTRVSTGAKPPAGAADLDSDQDLEVDVTAAGVVGQPATGGRDQRRGGTGHRRGAPAGSGEEPPGARSLDVAAG